MSFPVDCSKLTLPRVSGQRVVLLGDLVLDRFIYGTTGRISREAPVQVVQWEREVALPGGAANVAANLATQGAEVVLVGVVGADAQGAELMELLSGLGVGVEGVVVSAEVATTSKTRVLAGAFGTFSQQVLRLDREPPAAPGVELRAQLADALRSASRSGDLVLLSDYGYGAVTPELKLPADVRLVVDSRSSLKAYSGADTLKPNLTELEELAGRRLRSPALQLEAAQWLRKATCAQAVLLTLGRDGMLLADEEGSTAVGVFGHDEVTDVTGAGDSVLATYALALASGRTRIEAAGLATVAGGIAVSHQGTHQVTRLELEEALRSE